MVQQQQSPRRPTRKQLLWAGSIAALAFLIIVICGYLFGWKWTGLPKQTLWDWLDLLIVPAVLAAGGYLFTQAETRATQAAAERRAQEDALQGYLEQMGQLLLDKDQPLREPDADSEARLLARARTLTVLARLTGPRKARVVQFLYESDLIHRGRAAFHLAGADLSGADLSRAYLRKADLGGANLSGANLSGAELWDANLGLGVPPMGESYLTNLSGADLSGARLGEAILVGTDLSGADLSEARVSLSALGRAANFEGATMPNGQKYEKGKELEKYKEWRTAELLKDNEGRGEDGENTGP